MDSFPYTIRPIEPEKDAEEIAKLIRGSFRPWFDHDNIEYLNQLEREGEKAILHPLWTKIMGFPYNLSGVVCTDKDKITGVINTYPFYQNGRKCCLVANVCTAPEYRNKGVAAHMILEVEKMHRKQNTYGLYLQARTETAGTIKMYKNRGFSVTDFRKTWIYPAKKQVQQLIPTEFRIANVPVSEKSLLESMFQARYPKSILWNLDYKDELFDTGLLSKINRFLSLSPNQLKRVLNAEGETKLWYAIQHLREDLAQLWMIPNKNTTDPEIKQSLNAILRNWRGNRALRLDTPAADSDEKYKSAGFTLQQTLAWMFKRL